YTTPGAVAYVDFSVNEVPNVSSPLEYYGLEQCFRGFTERLAIEIDQRHKNNLFSLGFTQKTTYASSLEAGCSDLYSSTGQANFTFQERIAFQEYVRKSGDAEKPMRSIPFDAQKKLGFGLFTGEKLNPDQYGNIDKDGTRTALGEIFDLQNGKQITYVLAGVPEEEPARSTIIKATRDVVADINVGYRKAFAGTTLERKEDVVVLKIEGEDIESRQLGDLDRNYIYYIPKQTSSGVIGLGGAHANPRTGEVIAASVFIYGGNIIGAVDSMKKRAKAEKAYNKLVAVKTPSTPSSASHEVNPTLPGAVLGLNGGAPASFVGAKLLMKAVEEQYGPSSVSLLGDLGNKMTNLRSGSKVDFSSALGAIMKNPTLAEARGFSLMKGFDEARKRGVVGNERLTTNFVNESLATSFKTLAPEAARQKAISGVLERLEKAHYCAYDASQVAVSPQAIEDMSDLDAAMALYRPTLAHEIGHNLGLRHNFIGSFDKDNFKFEASEKTPRTYSSVMDYLVDDMETYDGLGPQDVSALRAAYAGLLELTPDAAKAAASAKNPVPLVSGKYVSLEDYKTLLGINSWIGLTPNAMEKAPLKKYMFCTDEDAGESPTCYRFDKGTTPSEVVDYYIHQYQSLYSLTNFAGDRLEFPYYRVGAYIGRIFGIFTPIRQFMEEGIFQAISGADQETVGPYIDAAVKSLFFLQSVVRTPDAPASMKPEDRFVTLTGEDKTQIRVERKWLKDMSADSNSERIDIRGIEFDKMIALILLTEREMGFARYERVSLRISFPQFEQMLIGKEESPLSYPTIGLLNELFSDSVTAGALSDGKLVQLPGQFKVETSESMRMYAVLGAMLSLDVSGLESSSNLSALFRVKSATTPPKGVTALLEPGLASKTNRSDLRLFAMDSAVAAKALVDQAYAGQVVEENSALVTTLTAYLLDNFAAASAKAPSAKAQLKQKQKEKAFNLQLSKLPESVGPRKVAEIQGMVQQVLVLVAKLELAKTKLSGEALLAQITQTKDLLESVAKGTPLIGSVLEAITGEQVGMELYDQVKPDGVIASSRGMIFSNAKTLSDLFYMSHPKEASN
ncbi:zinc-dependent metalloprotease, partial [Bdellovibrionota bacterium FG-2]